MEWFQEHRSNLLFFLLSSLGGGAVIGSIGHAVANDIHGHPVDWYLFSLFIVSGIALTLWSLRIIPTVKIPQHEVFTDLEEHKRPTISGRTFNNEVCDLDGKNYRNCTFNNCSLRFRGLAPFTFSDNNIVGSLKMATDNSAVLIAWGLLNGLGISNMPLIDDYGKPITNVIPPKKPFPNHPGGTSA